MTDLDYLHHAERALSAVERACDRINDAGDADIDNQRSGSMVTLIFQNQTQIIVNLQKPLQEIWMAAKAGGFHYQFNGKEWLDTKSKTEFFADLSRYASAQSGHSFVFEPAA